MVIAGDDYLTNDAIMFWGSHSPGDISDDLKAWLNIRVPEVQELWRTVGTMDRRRGMWLELREQLESRDPTNAWTRQYDDLYIEGADHCTLQDRILKAPERQTPCRPQYLAD